MPTRTHSSVSLLVVIGTLIFVLSIAAAGGVFAYEKILQAQISGMNAQLEEAQKALRPNDIIAWKELDYRIRSVRDILKGHTATSLLFEFLQSETLQRVRFQNFTYKDENGSLKLGMTGQADAYTTVALQAAELGKNKFLLTPLFEALTLDDQGRVSFKFSAIVDPTLLSYTNIVEPVAGVAEETASTEATTPAEGETAAAELEN